MKGGGGGGSARFRKFAVQPNSIFDSIIAEPRLTTEKMHFGING